MQKADGSKNTIRLWLTSICARRREEVMVSRLCIGYSEIMIGFLMEHGNLSQCPILIDCSILSGVCRTFVLSNSIQAMLGYVTLNELIVLIELIVA